LKKNARRLAVQQDLKKVPLDFFSVKFSPPPQGFATPVLAMLTTLRVALRGP
jgi:hypothetical protein